MQDLWKQWRDFRNDPRISDVREIEEDDIDHHGKVIGRRLSISALCKNKRIGNTFIALTESINYPGIDILERGRDALRESMIRWLADHGGQEM